MDFFRSFDETKIGATTADPNAVKGPSAKLAYGVGIGAGALIGFAVAGPVGTAVGIGFGTLGGYVARRDAVDLV